MDRLGWDENRIADNLAAGKRQYRNKTRESEEIRMVGARLDSLRCKALAYRYLHPIEGTKPRPSRPWVRRAAEDQLRRPHGNGTHSSLSKMMQLAPVARFVTQTDLKFAELIPEISARRTSVQFVTQT